MARLPSKPVRLVLALVGTVALGACGDSHTRVSTGTYAGESGANAPYLNVGPLVYEVQLSRQLSPYDPEDASYLEGLTPAERRLESGEEWFAVFIQVYNDSSTPHLTATSLAVTDTLGNTYNPVLPDRRNPFAYRVGMVPPKGLLPPPDSVAHSGPIQGALLLYKIKLASLDNRPLNLTIIDPTDPRQIASAELDV
jgi:hypothetical protein